MKYEEDIINEVQMQNDIVEVISGYIKLNKKGNNYVGLCPFHNEKSPSFSVSQSKQLYHCFGCGTSGNVFTFVMNYENYNFIETLKVLATRAGIELPEVQYTKDMQEKQSKKEMMLSINKDAANYFYCQVNSVGGSKAKEYLQERRLTIDLIKKFGLGFAHTTSDDLLKYLIHKGYNELDVQAAGLATYHEKYGTSDKFWNRVMFPIVDVNHRVIGFGGRVLGEGNPKYLNSPETLVFDKSRNLYGLNFARTSRVGHIIICEGYMDVIAMHQAGFTQAVASLGTAFTSGQANLLKRFTDKVYLAYDSDEAGIKATIRAMQILREVELSIKVISLEPFKDPDDFIQQKGKDEFSQRIASAENSFLFEIRMMEREYDLNDPEGKTKFYMQIAIKILEFSEEVERENYIEAIAQKYNIGYQNFRSMVYNQAIKKGLAKPKVAPKSGIEKKNTDDDVGRKAQRMLITWIVDEPNLYRKIKKYISEEDFVYPLYRKVIKRLFHELEEGNMQLAALVNMFEDEEEQKQVAALFNTKVQEITTNQEREKAFHNILYAVKKNSFEYYSSQLGHDVNALNLVITAKKALEELNKTHISLE